MASHLEKNKDQWMTPEFFQKLAANPRLLAAFQDPQKMAAMQEFGRDPKGAMAKYGNSPAFRELMQEFAALMGEHFTATADKVAAEEKAKKEKQEEELKKDPVYQTI